MGFKPQWMQEILSSPYLSRLTQGPTYPLCNGCLGQALSWAWCGWVWYWPVHPSSATVKDEWWYTAVPVMAYYGVIFTFTCLDLRNMLVVTGRHFCKIAKTSGYFHLVCPFTWNTSFCRENQHILCFFTRLWKLCCFVKQCGKMWCQTGHVW